MVRDGVEWLGNRKDGKRKERRASLLSC